MGAVVPLPRGTVNLRHWTRFSAMVIVRLTHDCSTMVRSDRCENRYAYGTRISKLTRHEQVVQEKREAI